MRGFGLGLYRRGAVWTPARLFTGGESGAWYDPSDLSTLWQDTAGTTPVTADGQTVARMDDKSGNGNHATQATAAARPLYKTDGTLHWLSFDGTDDYMDVPSLSLTQHTLMLAGQAASATASMGVWSAGHPWRAMLCSSSFPRMEYGWSGASAPTTAALSAFDASFVSMGWSDATSQNLQVDGGTVSTKAEAPGTYSLNMIGARTSSTNFFHGSVHQALDIDRALTPDEQAKLLTSAGSTQGREL